MTLVYSQRGERQEYGASYREDGYSYGNPRFAQDSYSQSSGPDYYRNKYQRGRTRGRPGYRRPYRGRQKAHFNENHSLNAGSASQADNVSCSSQSHTENFVGDKQAFNKKRGWKSKPKPKANNPKQASDDAGKEVRTNKEEDIISTLSEIKVEPKLMDKDVDTKASHNEWEAEEVPFSLLPKPQNLNVPDLNEVKALGGQAAEEPRNKTENFNSTYSQKTEKSTASFGSDLTKNSK